MPTETKNRFGELPVDQIEHTTIKTPAKPPPIMLYGIENVNELTKLIETTIDVSNFRFRIINKNLLRLMINSIEDYKKVLDLIRQKGLIGHTFTRKESRCYRIVIRNLHHTTPISAIKEALESTGNVVQGEIINARYGPDKTPTSTFFVNLEAGPNNKLIKDIEYIFHQHIKIEDPRKSKTIVQCQRCQQYGHSKNNCMRPYRCVKCGEGHKTADCPKKDRNTPAKCALCDSNHPANYKGCQVYKEILARKSKQGPRTDTISTSVPKIRNKADLETTESTKELPMISPNTASSKTYAEVTKNPRSNAQKKPSDSNHSQTTTTIENILIQQSEKIDLLMQQISTLLNLLTAIIPKLTK